MTSPDYDEDLFVHAANQDPTGIGKALAAEARALRNERPDEAIVKAKGALAANPTIWRHWYEAFEYTMRGLAP